MRQFFFLLGFLLLFASCGENGIFSIFDDSGNIIQKKFDLPAFDYLHLKSVFDVVLIQDSVYAITIEGDEDILKKVSADVSDSVLTMENNYIPKWLKPKSNKVKLYLRLKSLKEIDVYETSNVESQDTLYLPVLGVIFHCKLAEANIIINCNSFYYWDDFPCGGMLTLGGKAKNLAIWNFALMAVDAQNLIADTAYIENHSKGDCRVRAENILRYSILGQGNIYYYGTPQQIIARDTTSSGKLIKVDQKIL
jgi:hypothetical protein